MLSELYQEFVIDHSKNPRNVGVLDNADHQAHGHNPLCGDEVTLYLNVKDGVIDEIKFMGSGCAISQASASILTETVKGMSVREAEELFRKFHAAMTQDANPEGLGDLESLVPVREYPMRVKCATMSWHTLHQALQEKQTHA